MTPKALFLLISIPLVLIAGIVFLALYFFPAYEYKETPQSNTTDDDKTYNNDDNNSAPNKTIIREKGERGAEVTYKDGKFTPQEVTVESAGGSCTLRIINSGSAPLTIRLSPPPPRDNWGAMYDPIPPGGELIIDPRFRIPEIAFYNKEKPSEEFSVKLGPGCSEF